MDIVPLDEIYGLMAEFEDPDSLLEATRRAYQAGYRKMDAYTPFPIEGLAEALGMHYSWISAIVLGGGILGALTGFGMLYFSSVYSYPLNSGGKPANSWPAFIPITFELAILFAAIAAILSMFALNGLPQPYHPAFNLPEFEQASRHRFFLSIETADSQFEREGTHRFLENLGAVMVKEVEK